MRGPGANGCSRTQKAFAGGASSVASAPIEVAPTSATKTHGRTILATGDRRSPSARNFSIGNLIISCIVDLG